MGTQKFFIDDAAEIVPPVNDTPYKRIIAVGDVHGKFGKLMSLWNKLNVTDSDLLIFVGDYVDRGEGVAETLDWVLEMRRRKNLVFLRGNHEQMLLDAFSDENRELTDKFFSDKVEPLSREDIFRHGETAAWILYNGGNQTIGALQKLRRVKSSAVDDVLNFARSLPLSYALTIGGRQYFFCHAGVDGTVPLDNQPEEFLLWAREKFYNRYDGDAVIIGGHSPLQLLFDFGDEPLRPMKFPDKNILMIDTGSFIAQGKISAVDILSGQYWQSDPEVAGEIMFVCEWNTCRSAMAKFIMRHLLRRAGLDERVYVDSAGCITSGGEMLGTRTAQVLQDNGIDIDAHISQAFTSEHYKNFKCIIALDTNTLRTLKRQTGGDPDKKILMLRDAAGNNLSVADPGPTGNHAEVFAQIYGGCKALLDELGA